MNITAMSNRGLVAVCYGVVGVLLTDSVYPIFVSDFVIRVNGDGSVDMLKSKTTTKHFNTLHKAFDHIQEYYDDNHIPVKVDSENIILNTQFEYTQVAKRARRMYTGVMDADEAIKLLNGVGVL